MKRLKLKRSRQIQRKKSIRKKMVGTADCPRLSVFRSNRNLSVQAIDDIAGKTLVSISTLEKELKLGKGIEDGAKLGEALGKRLKDAKIAKVVFDRNGYKYHGVVKAIADGARKAGIEF